LPETLQRDAAPGLLIRPLAVSRGHCVAPLIIGEEEVEMIVSAFDAVMGEAMDVRGRVWAQSVQLIKHTLEGVT